MAAATLSAGLMMVACEEKMDYGEYVLNDKDYISQTFGGVGNLCTNVYSYLPYDWGQLYGGGMMASATDEAMCSVSNKSVCDFTNGAWTVVNNLDKRWASDYTGIQCANHYLENFQGMTFDDLSLNSDYDIQMDIYHYSFTEVRALRAFYYLDLVRNFGDVPYFTYELGLDEVNSIERTPALAVLDSVMKECDLLADTVVADYTTVQLGPDGAKVTGWPDAYTIRVNKDFVLATKARAALLAASPQFNTTGDKERWRIAAEANKAVIDEALATGRHKLAADYATIASAFPIEDKENIYSRMVYSGSSAATNNTLESYNYPAGISAGAGSGLNCPSQDLVDAYEMVATGLAIAEAGSGYDATNPYEGRDPRFALTVAKNGDVWPDIYADADDGAYKLETYKGGVSSTIATGGTPTSYYLKKGLDPTIDLRTGSTGVTKSKHSFFIFRLAEFYLNFAEAAFRYTGSATADFDGMTANDAVNAIRARAGMPDFPNTLAGDDWMRKYKNERFVELAFEGHRFYDLRRWRGDSDGIDAEHRMTSIGRMVITRTVAEDGSESFTYRTERDKRVWDNKMYLFPISQSETIKNPSLGQNPGW